ncbi:hypothetical protein HKX48_000309 [Thoreauomyces humboldtii]|nr:hypothetical protein HKX48_000309 [Thoreauomyces humboldtii]
MVQTKDIISTSAMVAAVLGVGYLAWFDRKRRTDPAFRRQLKSRARQAELQSHEIRERQARAAESRIPAGGAGGSPVGGMGMGMGGGGGGGGGVDPSSMPMPTDPEARAEYFLALLQYGESLAARGPQFHEQAAVAFFKAVQAYHDPMNLLMVLQQSLPEPVMQRIVALCSAAEGAGPANGGGANITELDAGVE